MTAPLILGVLAACGIPARFIAPASWKRAVGLHFGSKDARAEAIHRWPGQAALFARAKDDGRAEVSLIAIAGLARASAKGAAP
jgi:crossover junction endodeoxyribonuclease RuvC